MTHVEPVMRPMNIGELLDHAISLYRRNFLTLTGIVALIALPLVLIQLVAAVLALPTDLFNFNQRPASAINSSMLIYFVAIGIVYFIYGFASIFEGGALIAVVSESFHGKRMGIKQAYGRALRRGLPLLSAAILIGLFYFALFGGMLIPFLGLIFASSAGSSSSVAAATGLFSLCVCAAIAPALLLATFFYVRWIFWQQAIVVENKGARAGLGRSWRLVPGSFWRIFFVMLLLNLFIAIITTTPTYAISFASLMLPSPIFSTVTNYALSMILNIFTSPIRHAMLTLLFYDTRIRKEGYDLELQAQQLAGATA